MTDERLQELRDDLAKAIDTQVTIKRQREDAHSRVQQLAAEVQRLNTSRKELDIPYRNATERVADLSHQIHDEERRRAGEAAAKLKAAEQQEAVPAE